jgi:hypothetical protein
VIATVAVAAVLTKAQYQALIDRANARIEKVDSAAQKGITPHAKPLRVAALIDAMGQAELANAAMFAAAHPPAPVAEVNREIVHAERVFAAEDHAIAQQIRHAKNKRATAMRLLQRGPQRGPKLLDAAIAKLHRLGYH